MSTRTTAELLAVIGSAFCATLLGVAARDLDVQTVVGDRLLEELRKRGFAVCPRSDDSAATSGST